MGDETIRLRSFAEPLSDEEREFHELGPRDGAAPVWPRRCVNSMEAAAGTVILTAESRGDAVIFRVPVSANNLEARRRNFGWVTQAGLWIAYAGIIGFFIVLYFYFSMTESRRVDRDLLFLLGVTSIITTFLGFYFVRLMQSLSPGFRRWLAVPAVRAHIERSTPLFRDLSFEFENAGYAAEFAAANAHLLIERLDEIAGDRLKRLRERVAADEANADAHFELGLGYERIGDFGEAERCFERVIELDAERAEAHRHLGACRFAQGDERGAEEALNLAHEKDPAEPDALMLLAALHEAGNKRKQAEEALREAVRLVPDDADVRARAGEFHLRYRHWGAARKEFEAALEIAPEHETARIGLGAAVLRMKDAGSAEELSRQLEQLHPALADRLRRLANSGR